LGTGEIDAVRFGTGPNQQPFRIDMGSQQNGQMGQGFGQPQGGPPSPFGLPQALGAPATFMGPQMGFNGMMQPPMQGGMGMFGSPNSMFGGFGGGMGMAPPPPERPGFFGGFFGNRKYKENNDCQIGKIV